MPFKIDPNISTGNLMNLAVLLLAGGIAWGTLRSQQVAQERRIDAVETEAVQRDSRIRAVEISQAGTASDVRSIQAGIVRIENKIDELSRVRVP